MEAEIRESQKFEDAMLLNSKREEGARRQGI